MFSLFTILKVQAALPEIHEPHGPALCHFSSQILPILYAFLRSIKLFLSFAHEEQISYHHIHPGWYIVPLYFSRYFHEQVFISHNDTQKHTFFIDTFREKN